MTKPEDQARAREKLLALGLDDLKKVKKARRLKPRRNRAVEL
jgi:hypothetical protein